MTINYAKELQRIRVESRRCIKKIKAHETKEANAIYKLVRFRNVEIAAQHSLGVSYVALAKRFALSPTRIRSIVIRENSK